MASNPPTSALEQAKVTALQNARYHADRQAWFLFNHRLLMAVIIFGGSWALLEQLSGLGRSIAALVAVGAATLDLVFDLAGRGAQHAFLQKQYLAVAARLETPRPSPSAAQTQMMLLAGEEEPPYFAAHALAENWAVRAVLGPSASLPCKVGFVRKRLRHLLRYDQVNFSC